MKYPNPILKCQIRVIALFLICLISSVVHAQQPPQPCHITITSDFESLCLLPLDKDSVYDEEPETIIACQESTVNYTASTNTGGIPVVQWVWSVVGASSWNDNGNGSITVTWSNSTTGQLSVFITTANGYSCSSTQNVKLIEKPSILVSTVPAYSELPDGSKIIYVCQGETVEFSDLSSTTNTDIVGYFWDSPFYNLTASSPNFRIENVWHEDQVIHRVYNNCGCYDEETYIIKVMHGDILDLGCYGTVCQDAVVTYTANNPPCSQYSWYVDGGTIIGAQDQQSVTVQWDNPQNGYGIIGLDGSLCGGNACPSMLSKKIPIIEDTINIKGQEVACVDEAVIYSIPLYGSTRYTWDIQPTNGADIFEVNGANQKGVVFTQPGTYQIIVSYECEFLNCGEFTSKPLIVTVKPKLKISGEERICITNNCDLRTDPNVVAIWEVQDMGNNNNTIHTSPSTSSFSYHFPHAGKYRITAENPNYCRPAVFVITVVAAPPTPTEADFDPNNPTIACPHSGILLKANPTNPDYTIVWKPSCADAVPQTVSGNSVTINYQTTVCDINAYNYDRVLGCLSETPYVHTVSEFQLADHNLPTEITICPGAVLNWSVPNQSSVIYEWQLQSNKQFCASVQGDIFSNAIELLVNEIATPETFTLTLKREYCSDLVDYHTITINVRTDLQATLSINAPSQVCQYSQVQLSGSGCNDSYEWNIEDNIQYGSSIDYTFNNPGNIAVTMKCNPYYSCPNSDYYVTQTAVVNVIAAPAVSGISYDPNSYPAPSVVVTPTSLSTNDYDFVWDHTSINSNRVPAINGQWDYSCTVIDKNPPYCSATVNVNVQPCQNTLNVIQYQSYEYCSKQVSFHAANAFDDITWDITGGECSVVQIWGIHNEYITLRILEAGYYTIKASVAGETCYSGSYSFPIDFVPKFSIEKACGQIIIHNRSSYLSGASSVTISRNGGTISFPVIENTITVSVPSGTYNLELTSFNGNSINPGCSLGTVTIANTANLPVSIDIDNPTTPLYQTCDNTAIQLTASIPVPHSIDKIEWNFGDFSSSGHSNPIYHTFEKNYPYYYTVTAKITDENNCTSTGTVNVRSNKNDLIPNAIITIDPVQCDGNPRQIKYSPDPIGTSYDWSVGCLPTNTNPVSVFRTSDYHVDVENQNYCKAKKNKNVSFLNRPMALIVTASAIYCEGETIKFYGSPDPDSNDYTFNWTITDISTGNSVNYPYATISYTPPHAGNYIVDLTIASINGCSAFTSETITVNPTPAAPTISFGSNECIDNPPVVLNGSAPSTSDINWSNGNVGPNAYYFSPGMATAWYYDPNTGCKSEEAKIHIEPQPDFDALLTGCYEKCRAFFETNPRLPVWGLSSGRENIRWKWCLNATGIANGIVSYPNYSLSLPLQGFGDYNLNLDYHNGNCGTLISPTLTINPKDTCDCQDLDVSYICKWHVEDCKIFYDVDVTVCNNSTTHDCLRNIEYLFNTEHIDVVYTDFASTTLNPGDCYSFHMTILASQFLPSSTISFRLYDECNNCTTDFSINLMPEKIDCEMDMQLLSLDINPGLSSSVAAYFDFNFDVSPCQNLIAFWTEPPMVINYWYDGAAMVQGLGMVDYAALTQLMAENGNICFYAITCEGDHLCKRKFCLSAEEIFNSLLEMGLVPTTHTQDSKTATSQQSKTSIQDSDAEPHLMPNPTTGEVNVIGTADEVIEVLVMDMNGRQMATFENAKRFNIAHLATGHYIVRLKTQHNTTEKVTYLKLIKQ